MDLIRPRGTAEVSRPDDSAEPTRCQDKEQAGEFGRHTSNSSDGNEADNEITGININTFTRRMMADTVRDLDGLIDHLQNLRKKLLGNGSWVEREIADYTAMGQSVTELTKIIADSVSHLKTGRT